MFRPQKNKQIEYAIRRIQRNLREI